MRPDKYLEINLHEYEEWNKNISALDIMWDV